MSFSDLLKKVSFNMPFVDSRAYAPINLNIASAVLYMENSTKSCLFVLLFDNLYPIVRIYSIVTFYRHTSVRDFVLLDRILARICGYIISCTMLGVLCACIHWFVVLLVMCL